MSLILPAAALVMAVILDVGKEHRRLSGGLALLAGLAGGAIAWQLGLVDI